MNTYISMLRGINITGHKTVPMPRLKALYESIGLSDVTTYIQSGNVIFTSARNDRTSLRDLIEKAVERTFGFHASVILRRDAELRKIIRLCPFVKIRGIDQGKLHVTFLDAKPSPSLVAALGPLAAKSRDEFEASGKEVYLHCPNGYGKTLLSTTFFEEHLNVEATTRNWKTVNALAAMCGEHS